MLGGLQRVEEEASLSIVRWGRVLEVLRECTFLFPFALHLVADALRSNSSSSSPRPPPSPTAPIASPAPATPATTTSLAPTRAPPRRPNNAHCTPHPQPTSSPLLRRHLRSTPRRGISSTALWKGRKGMCPRSVCHRWRGRRRSWRRGGGWLVGRRRLGGRGGRPWARWRPC